MKLIVAGLSVFSILSTASLLGQIRRVLVVKPGDAELRRTAAHLRMCPEQVQNIRQLLDEASDLLPESGSGQVASDFCCSGLIARKRKTPSSAGSNSWAQKAPDNPVTGLRLVRRLLGKL